MRWANQLVFYFFSYLYQVEQPIRAASSALFFSLPFLPAFPPVRSFLPLISAPTGFLDWGLVGYQVGSTTDHLPYCFLPSKPKDDEGKADRVIAN